MVYDTLLATMPISRSSADGGLESVRRQLTYTFTLRDGLKWHDGAPVTAEDCVASLKRWGKGDGMGQKLFDFTESLEATRRQDDHAEVEGALRSRFGIDRQAIVAGAFMMPKRLAENAADQQIPNRSIGTVQVRGIGIPAGCEGGL